jgi:hypothetical protein
MRCALDSTRGTLAPASIRNNDSSISIGNCLCSTPEHSPYTSLIHSFQLPAYEQGKHARLNRIHDDLRARGASVTMCLETLRPNTSLGCRWTSESQRCVLCHVSPLVLRLRLNSRQADRALIVVRHTSAAQVYKLLTDSRDRCRTLTKLS